MQGPVAVVSVMLGQLTKLAMPMWLVPFLGITSRNGGEVLGYTIVLMFILFFALAGGLPLL